MIDENQKTLLELLKATLFHEIPIFSDKVNWNSIFEIAKKQTVVALAEPHVPDAYKETWQKAVLQETAHYIRILNAQNEILDALQKHGITTVVIKGTAASIYYPEPSRRAMGDIDLLVSVDRYQEAKCVLQEKGYCFLKEDFRNSVYKKAGIEIELHCRFSSEENDIEYIFKEGMNSVVFYTIEFYSFMGFPKYINGIVLLEHIRIHLVRNGLGLRQIIDWMMFVHSSDLNDDSWNSDFKLLAQEAKLEKLAITLTFLCKKWIGLPDKISWCDDGDNELVDMLLSRLFADGNFGRDNFVSDYPIRRIKSGKPFAFLQQTGLMKWNATKKYPILRPFAWIYQIIHYVIKGSNELLHGKNILKEFKSSDEKQEILRRLGIDYKSE